MPTLPPLLELGTIGRAHGIQGELSLVWHGENPPLKGQVLYIKQADGSFASARILSARCIKGRPVLRLAGISDRTAAEGLNGHAVFMDRASLAPLEKDEAYLADLCGSVILLPDGKPAGIFDHAEFPAGQQIWVIKGLTGNEILFPAQPRFIDFIDVENKKIGINPPPGLLDIYNA